VSPENVIWLLLWGTLVGIDLVSVPQMMIARPLVAGAGAGLLVGDVEMGLRLGVVLELFQFDVLPVGAARYPEYGPATVAAVVLAHGIDGASATGVGVGLALVLAMVGGLSLHGVRTLNARAVRHWATQLEAGDPRTLTRLHLAGMLRDLARALSVTAFSLAVAWLAIRLGAATLPAPLLVATSVAVCGAALATGGMGLLRLVGRGSNLKWLAAGVTAGLVLAWLA
jgi:mannose/fructose/N-acetylgalactosamine-specific phosphotransferase system component IIC